MTMTEKQRIFADEYVKDSNGTRAYKAAYTNVKKDSVAATNAGRLLRNAEVRTYIDKQLEKLHNERTADAQELREYFTSLTRGEQTEVVVTNKGEVIRIEVPARDRIKAAELLGKTYAMFTDKSEVQVTEPPKFEDDIP